MIEAANAITRAVPRHAHPTGLCRFRPSFPQFRTSVALENRP